MYKNKALKHKNELLNKEKQINDKELVTKSLALLRNNEILLEIVEKLSTVEKQLTIENKKLINKIIKEVEMHSRQNMWEEFETAFKNVHENFNKILFEISPNLTPSELKLAALLKLNLSTKEIAAITFKSESGIKTTRHRLRKKLNLESNDNLVTFLLKI